VRELRQLREENRKLKQVVADLTLDQQILKEAMLRRWPSLESVPAYYHGGGGTVMILITGASGNVGSEVLKRAAVAGLPTRAAYHSRQNAQRAPAGVETVVMEYTSSETVGARCAECKKSSSSGPPVPSVADVEGGVVRDCKSADLPNGKRCGHHDIDGPCARLEIFMKSSPAITKGILSRKCSCVKWS
jgi:hypothetical protein